MEESPGTHPRYWPFILIIVNTWKNLGYNVILYYATLVGIDLAYYEAAVVDGAGEMEAVYPYYTSRAQRARLSYSPCFRLAGFFYSDFGLFYQIPMDSGVLLEVTNTIDLYVYHGLMESGNMGMSSAAGVYQSCVGFLLGLLANFVVRKLDQESALF